MIYAFAGLWLMKHLVLPVDMGQSAQFIIMMKNNYFEVIP